MDRQVILEHLEQAERHVREGAVHVANQLTLVNDLERNGQDSRAARALLKEFEELQARHVADRERLRGELAKTRPAASQSRGGA